MPDNAPDQPGGRPPGGGSRRSGLDRLRAARGGGEPPNAAGQQSATSSVPADTAPGETETADTATRETVTGETAKADSRSGATASASGTPDTAPTRTGVLLDEPRSGADTSTVATDTEADSDTAGDVDATTGTDAPGRSGRRDRKRAAAATAATAAARAASTADAPAGRTAAGRRRFRRDRTTTPLTGPASRRQKIAALLLGLVVIGLLVPVVIMRHRIVGQTADERAVDQLTSKRTIALSTARRFAVTFFSPDYKTIEDYNKQVLAGSTGQFNQDFASKQADLKSLVTKAQSQATGRILTAGVSKVSGDDVEVLVVADQSVQNTLTKGQAQVLRTRVRITVHKTPDKGWLVSGFEPVT